MGISLSRAGVGCSSCKTEYQTFENMNSIKYWLDHHHFLKVDEGRLVFWNYRLHDQYEIDIGCLVRLIEFSKGSALGEDLKDKEILDAGVVIREDWRTNWGWDWLAHIFHCGTCHPLSVDPNDSEYNKSYIDYCSSIEKDKPAIDVIKGGEIIGLPTPELSAFKKYSLWESLIRRRTCRDFNGSSVELSDVSDLLFATFGDQHSPDSTTPENAKVFGYRRTSPSAGGLNCTEAYLWAINIEGIPEGIYHYLPRRHQLEVVSTKLPEYPIGAYLCNQNWANHMAFAVIMTCRMDKMWWKYPHSRAYRPMLMDVGHLSQTLNLCITAKNLHPWITGYFHDKEIASILQCDEGVEHPILLVGAGNGSGSSFSKDAREDFRKLEK